MSCPPRRSFVASDARRRRQVYERLAHRISDRLECLIAGSKDQRSDRTIFRAESMSVVSSKGAVLK